MPSIWDNHIDNCGKKDKDCAIVRSCDRTAHKSFEVFLPIEITPYVVAKEPKTSCKEGLKIKHGFHPCEDKHKSYKYTISQVINIEIPLEYGAEVCYKDYCLEEEKKCDEH